MSDTSTTHPEAATINGFHQLEVDTTVDDDQDSSVGEDRYTRYHAFDDNAYFLPNDELEAARLDLQHYIWKITFDGGSGRVPITPNMKNVLDVGTGTGIWAMEFAEAHPDINVLGTDLSPIQPDYVPRNCQFIVDNAELDWVFDRKFDYIHSRMLVMGMHDWVKYFRQCWDFLEPGGWLETSEAQFPPRRAKGEKDGPSALIEWGNHIYTAAAKAGIDARASERFTELLRAQGFVNVDRLDVQWPIRPWAKGKKNKLMGRLLWENSQQAIPAVGTALFTRSLGWTIEMVEQNSADCLKDAEENCYYYPMVLHRAQKPPSASK